MVQLKRSFYGGNLENSVKTRVLRVIEEVFGEESNKLGLGAMDIIAWSEMFFKRCVAEAPRSAFGS